LAPFWGTASETAFPVDVPTRKRQRGGEQLNLFPLWCNCCTFSVRNRVAPLAKNRPKRAVAMLENPATQEYCLSHI
jgi:hypothetical protein